MRRRALERRREGRQGESIESTTAHSTVRRTSPADGAPPAAAAQSGVGFLCLRRLLSSACRFLYWIELLGGGVIRLSEGPRCVRLSSATSSSIPASSRPQSATRSNTP